MKKSRFSEEQIIAVLKEHQAGIAGADLCRKHGISDATFNSLAHSNKIEALPPGRRRWWLPRWFRRSGTGRASFASSQLLPGQC